MLEKKLSVQVKIGILMTVAVILLSTTFYLSYRSLSSIVSSIPIGTSPEIRLLSIRDISMDLEEAENSVRIFTITGDSKDIQPYYDIISSIDEKVNQLRTESINDLLMLEQLDTISRLIEENIVIWNELLYLAHDDKVDEYLKHLSDQLDSISNEEENKQNGILRRVFSRRSESRLDAQELISDLNKLEQQGRATNEELMTRESQLAITGNKISEQFYDLIVKMESDLSRHIEEKALEAGLLAGKTYRWLAMFSVSGALLLILILYIIIRYVRRTYTYQVALENSKNEAEKLARTKELFMANMSHEIRTPVTAISGFTDQLLHESFDQKTTQAIKVIKSSSDQLIKIIDDILDFSRLQDGKLELEKIHFRIREVIEDVHAMFKMQALRNKNRFSYSLSQDVPPVLLGDPYRLKQIMMNLTGNSIKFTREGEVQLNVKYGKKQTGESELIMEFIDTGIGIEESKLNLIFEDFTQAEMDTTRKYGGTGLGLSIVKKLVELHHGIIECESRKDEGTKITCRIPCISGDEKQIKKEVISSPDIPEAVRRLKILIVDDEEYNRLLFKTIFNRWKIKYNEAVNGTEALEMIMNNRFDLIFMDVRMPGTDGLKATEYIRSELELNGSDLPVIGISAAITGEDTEKYLKAGMNAILPKPFTEGMLLSAMRSVIKIDKQDLIMGASNKKQSMSSGNEKINLVNLYHIAGGDEKFVRLMITSFIESTEKGLMNMNEAMKKGEWESIADVAHKISSPCRHIGAMELYHFLKKIEDNIRNKLNIKLIRSLSGEAINEFEAVRDLLHEHIERLH